MSEHTLFSPRFMFVSSAVMLIASGIMQLCTTWSSMQLARVRSDTSRGEWHVVDITLTDLRHEMIQVKCNRLAYAMEVYNANGGYTIKICKTGIHCWALNARYDER